MEDGLTIAQASVASGISAYTLRCYERESLLEPIDRNGGGHRRFREVDLATLRFLGFMRATGMGIAALRESMRLARLDACLAVVDRKIALCCETENALHQGTTHENKID